MDSIGICGDNCSFCSRYLATQSGETEELEKVKELWVRLGLRDPSFPPQGMACYGCRPENDCAYSEVRACAYGKGLENCGLCQIYPCELLHAVIEKSEKLSSHAVHVCTPEEMDALYKAFLCKQQNLDRIHFDRDKANTIRKTADMPRKPPLCSPTSQTAINTKRCSHPKQ